MNPVVEPTLTQGFAQSPGLYAIAIVGAAAGTLMGLAAIVLRRRKARARALALGAILVSLLTTFYGVVGWLVIRDRTDDAVGSIASTLTEGQIMLTRAAGYAEAKLMLYFAATVALLPLFIGIASAFFMRRPTAKPRKQDVEIHPLDGRSGEAAS